MSDRNPIITGEVCGKCKFARRHPDGTPGLEFVCKRNPPLGTALPIGRRDDGSPVFMHYSWYPGVGEHEEGCGEFKVKLALTN